MLGKKSDKKQHDKKPAKRKNPKSRVLACKKFDPFFDHKFTEQIMNE